MIRIVFLVNVVTWTEDEAVVGFLSKALVMSWSTHMSRTSLTLPNPEAGANSGTENTETVELDRTRALEICGSTTILSTALVRVACTFCLLAMIYCGGAISRPLSVEETWISWTQKKCSTSPAEVPRYSEFSVLAGARVFVVEYQESMECLVA